MNIATTTAAAAPATMPTQTPAASVEAVITQTPRLTGLFRGRPVLLLAPLVVPLDPERLGVEGPAQRVGLARRRVRDRHHRDSRRGAG